MTPHSASSWSASWSGAVAGMAGMASFSVELGSRVSARHRICQGFVIYPLAAIQYQFAAFQSLIL